MLLAGGTLDGVEVLKPDTVKLMARNATQLAALIKGLDWMRVRARRVGAQSEQFCSDSTSALAIRREFTRQNGRKSYVKRCSSRLPI
jgi:hypothetical protein